jgi:hypothetical protein
MAGRGVFVILTGWFLFKVGTSVATVFTTAAAALTIAGVR